MAAPAQQLAEPLESESCHEPATSAAADADEPATEGGPAASEQDDA